MNFFIRYKVFAWILAGLLVIALSALGTMVWHVWFESDKEVIVQQTPPGCSTSCMILTSELDLNPNQNRDVETIISRSRQSSSGVVTALHEKRNELLEELTKDAPDTTILKRISEEIGEIQGRLMMNAVDQYLQLRDVCDPDQQEKLTGLYYELFGCPRAGQMMHRQGRARHGQNGQ
jgi:Spy/CpxP family protein refolding chaperone